MMRCADGELTGGKDGLRYLDRSRFSGEESRMSPIPLVFVLFFIFSFLIYA